MALISNPENPVSPGGVMAIAIVFTVIVWILASIRFWALRNYSYRPFSPRWISNVAVMLITLFVTVSLALLFYAYHVVYAMRDLENEWITLEDKRGVSGLSDDEITAKQIQVEDKLMYWSLSTMKSSLAWRVFSTTALWLVKFSIVMVYVELMDTVTKRMRWLMFGTLWIIGLTYAAIIALFCVGMPSENWGQSKNSDLPIITEYLYGIANIFTDLLVLVIALWSLHAIKLPQSKLYAISILIFMGCVTIGLAITRTILYYMHIRSEKPLDQSVDLIGLVEPLVASWLACLPALRVLFRNRRRSRVEGLEARLRELRSSGHERIASRGSTGSRTGCDPNLSEIGRVGYGGYENYRVQDAPAGIDGTGIAHEAEHEYCSDSEGSIRSGGDDENDGRVQTRRTSVRLSSYTCSDGSTQVGDETQPSSPSNNMGDMCPWAMGKPRNRGRGFTFDSTSPLSPTPQPRARSSNEEKKVKPSKDLGQVPPTVNSHVQPVKSIKAMEGISSVREDGRNGWKDSMILNGHIGSVPEDHGANEMSDNTPHAL